MESMVRRLRDDGPRMVNVAAVANNWIRSVTEQASRHEREGLKFNAPKFRFATEAAQP